MSLFHNRILAAAPEEGDIASRRWIYVPYDRLTERTGPLCEQPGEATGIVMVESVAKATRRPYHKKKLVLLIANMRHFALEQAARGVKLLYHFSSASHGQALLELQRQRGLPALTVMLPAEREHRLDLAQAVREGLKLIEVADTTWLSTTEDFVAVFGSYKTGRHYVMDRFYRRMRQQRGVLMDGAEPVGGRFSYDAENRSAYKGTPKVPRPPVFVPDAITAEVIQLIEKNFPNHFGSIEGFDLPTTQTECDSMWRFALENLLPSFGPFEDAMRDDEEQLFHSRTSPLINLGRMLPADLIRDVEDGVGAGRIPLPSAEGFIRQILGWREFMRHVHQQTDGYRLIDAPKERRPKTGGTDHRIAGWDTGAAPSALGASLHLPAVYWGVESGLHCVDTVVAQVLREGWSHHITRLMVLSNLATLCGFSPRELTDWFWFAYIDAYDWVVETNVLGMSTYADGGITATKPYVSGAAYIHRMSNYCGHCKFDPKMSTGEGSCPFTALYWTFLERNEAVLGGNFRLQMPYQTLRKKAPEELVQLRARAEEAIAALKAAPRPEY